MKNKIIFSGLYIKKDFLAFSRINKYKSVTDYNIKKGTKVYKLNDRLFIFVDNERFYIDNLANVMDEFESSIYRVEIINNYKKINEVKNEKRLC